MRNLSAYVVKELGIFSPEQSHGFILIKPGEEKYSQAIIRMFEDRGWSVAKVRTKTLLEKEAKALYAPHKDKDFFKPLVQYMISGPCTGIVLTRKGEASKKDFKDIAEVKDLVRERWGESDMRNVLHSSDSEERFKEEAGIFFWL